MFVILYLKTTFHLFVNMCITYIRTVGRDSSVDIATRYRLDGPGIESRWGRDFPHPSPPVLGAHPASYIMGTGFFLWGKAAGAWR